MAATNHKVNFVKYMSVCSHIFVVLLGITVSLYLLKENFVLRTKLDEVIHGMEKGRNKRQATFTPHEDTPDTGGRGLAGPPGPPGPRGLTGLPGPPGPRRLTRNISEYLYIETADPVAVDCLDIYRMGNKTSGNYRIKIHNKAHLVRCDQTTDGGGWTVIQRRVDGTEDFNRPWATYRAGFGNIDTEYWLGLENIHQLMKIRKYELRIDLTFRHNSEKRHIKFDRFQISAENDFYRLSIGDATGTANNQMTYHNNARFTTHDRDNDAREQTIFVSNANCGANNAGGWWYRDCYRADLNSGHYSGGNVHFQWSSCGLSDCALRGSEMKIRPVT